MFWYFQSHHGDTLLNFATVNERVSIFSACVCIVIVLGVNVSLCAWMLMLIMSVGVGQVGSFVTVVVSFHCLFCSQICQTDYFKQNSAHFIALTSAFCGCFLPVNPSTNTKILAKMLNVTIPMQRIQRSQGKVITRNPRSKFQSWPFPFPFDR